jgi:integrase
LAGTRLDFKHGAFYYRHRDGRWERIGTDLAQAKQRARIHNDPGNEFGTVAWWLDQFILHCEQRVKAGELSRYSHVDYGKCTPYLKAYFGLMLPEQIQPVEVQSYLVQGKIANRAVRANREKATLSACLSWMIAYRGKEHALRMNPCLRLSGVKRNAEKPRDRYVTDEEFAAVYRYSPKQVQLLMNLTLVTLQRPESDILLWTPAILGRSSNGKVALRFRQNKTNADVTIAVTNDLGRLIHDAMGDLPQLHQTLVHNRKGEAYTYSGIMTMLTRAIKKANVQRGADEQIATFGFRDLKGKGATDMWRRGVPVEQIQLLCAHKNKATTEKYIKARWKEPAEPNKLPGTNETRFNGNTT